MILAAAESPLAPLIEIFSILFFIVPGLWVIWILLNLLRTWQINYVSDQEKEKEGAIDPKSSDFKRIERLSDGTMMADVVKHPKWGKLLARMPPKPQS